MSKKTDDLEDRKVSDWMHKFSADTAPPEDLPAPGLLLFKARLMERQSAESRAVQPIVRMQFVAVILFAAGIGWLLLKSQSPVGPLFNKTFFSLLSIAPMLVLGVIAATAICLAFAYFLRNEKEPGTSSGKE